MKPRSPSFAPINHVLSPVYRSALLGRRLLTSYYIGTSHSSTALAKLANPTSHFLTATIKQDTMVIAPAIPGLEVTVEVDNVPLPEHQYEDEDETSDGHEAPSISVTRYLEVPSGAEFSIRTLFKEPFDATMPVHTDLYIDNNYIRALRRETGDMEEARGFKYAMVMSSDEEQTVTQKLRFSEIDLG